MSLTTNELRALFLDYFKNRSHAIVEGSSLVPANDPSLLFTNAGMNQFKGVFVGKEVKSYQTAVSVQRCMRVSGKHNDIEMVGYTLRHHTFFEMLGNFSFGDYFKREAINYAWEFLTKELKIPPERLWVTVYKKDKEAEEIWLRELKVDPNRFSRCGEKDNFWAMGDIGPCGPCSEIFYDHGPGLAGGPPGTAEEEGERYVEIWNLVFMQYNRQTDGTLISLPKPSVDTGMGLERIAAAVQGVHDNYQIDIFTSLIKKIKKIIKVKNCGEKALRVIADHSRAATFLVADGIIPTNEGRGYVLRRIMRRAIRHAYKFGVTKSFLHKIVGAIVAEMGQAYPYLIAKQDFIEKIILKEEQQFAVTLEQGLAILEQEITNLKASVIPGELVFKLYDTYGFPADLTADIARERNLQIDETGFATKMAQQRANSKQSSKFVADFSQNLQLTGTTEFHGYEKLQLETEIVALLSGQQTVSELHEGEKGVIVLLRTPFYAESGGQVGDKGEIYTTTGCFQVVDTQKHGAVYLHHGKLIRGVLETSNKVVAEVASAREQIARNHTATHLLHAALRQIVGSQVEQKGSLVEPDRLRFDFSSFEPLTIEQIAAVERTVNQKIRENLSIITAVMTPAEAKRQGAMALFSEKYGAEVRVVTVTGAEKFSQELCGGTHVTATGAIGLFKIITETGIAAGIRRIEAITGSVAFDYLLDLEHKANTFSTMLKTDLEHSPERLQHLLKQMKQQEKELTNLKTSAAKLEVAQLAAKAVEISGVRVISTNIPGLDRNTMRQAVDLLKQQSPTVVVLATVIAGRIELIVGVSKDFCSKLNANNLLQYLTGQIGGKGGGRADMAQGGGVDLKSLEPALQSVADWVAKKIK